MKNNTMVLVKQNDEKEWRKGYKFYFKKVDGKHLCYAGGDKRTFVSWDCIKEYNPPTLNAITNEENCKNPYFEECDYSMELGNITINIIIRKM